MTQNNFPIITVDGPSGAGKGTLCLQLAEHYSFHLLDSGSLYRLTALAAQRTGIDLHCEADVASVCPELAVEFKPGNGGLAVFMGDENVTSALRTEAMGMAASTVAAHPQVRTALVDYQRSFVKAPGLVADGRDMGTTIFPAACAKIFLTASAQCRANRRHQQLLASGVSADLDQIVIDIEQRDLQDSQRASSPLAPADDAVLLDSSSLSIDQVFTQAVAIIDAKLALAAGA